MSGRIPAAENFSVSEKPAREAASFAGLPDVTVVTVVFNAVRSGRRERFVQCLDSVQAQSGCKVEHLVVDGASTDGTVDIVRDYASRAVPIRWISASDRGIYDAMNRGIALARGKYVVFLNSDDRFVNPNGMRASFEALEARGADYSYAPLYFVGANGREVDRCFPTADEMLTLFHGMTICHQTLVMRREVLIALDGFDRAYRSGADYDLLMRTIYAGYRGVRVEERFVEFQGGGFSAVNDDLSDIETDRLFQCRLREAFGVDMPEARIRCMRHNLEWPPELADRIRQVGERSFPSALPPMAFERTGWEKCVKWRFDQALVSALWQLYGPMFPFVVRHPLHALGALKAWLVHRHDDPLPLRKWLEVRCALMADQIKSRGHVVYPCEDGLGDQAERRSGCGLICTDALRLERSGLRLRGSVKLFVCLASSALQERESAVEVLANGTSLGAIALKPYTAECWKALALPGSVGRADRLEIELKVAGGGRFVFGGLCFI